MRGVADEIRALDTELMDVDRQLRESMLLVPNIPHASVPEGKTPADNQVIATWGEEVPSTLRRSRTGSLRKN